ncbi:MAG: urocanate hydratase [Elusimicrobiota bacterium]
MAKEILAGIPEELPAPRPYDATLDHAPQRKDILTAMEKHLAIKNALRYFPAKHHAVLAKEFADELRRFGRIYMHRLRPERPLTALAAKAYPHKSKAASAIMMMIDNNLDAKVAQHPHELITYGGNGAVFQNWAQYRLTMRYLATMDDTQTLVLYSGHPLGLFPSSPQAPRLVITNGMMVPNYSKPDDWERYNALGVTQYGQMTAGSFMYIGPQGIVHGTTITLMNAARRTDPGLRDLKGKVFVSSGLGGMSGAQAKAAVICGAVGVIAEINPKAIAKRHAQGWLHEVHADLDTLLRRIEIARRDQEAVSLGYLGNIVDLWERLGKDNLDVDLGSDQTSLHNPHAGGYYPVGLTLEASNAMLREDPELFKTHVSRSLVRQTRAIGVLAERGMYFWDYGNAFLLQAARAGADIAKADGGFKYPSYVEDIMGPLCFDLGFGPFRWVCASGDAADLQATDDIAASVLRNLLKTAPAASSMQLRDNLRWIENAASNRLVVGSQARILYADLVGRIAIASAFNKAVRSRRLKAAVIIGRDHHDVSGTDSPWRETSDIRDGSRFTADMAVHNVIGDACRGATWVSLHNGGGTGWGEAINGGFGLVLDGSAQAQRAIKSMLSWDVANGLARRSWARNPAARQSILAAAQSCKGLAITLPNDADDDLIRDAL